MRLLIFSDLHFEFHHDGGVSFISQFKDADYDVAVLAGDLAPEKFLNNSLKLISDNFKRVLYVAGNHEYYHSSIDKTNDKIKNLTAKYTNISFLNNEIITIDNHRFLGTSLWFPFQPDNYKYQNHIADFALIKDAHNNISPNNRLYKLNEEALLFLDYELSKDDILITHHLPSYQCVAAQFLNSPLNRFFVCNIENLIINRKPSLAIHGHTHTGVDFKIQNTRIVANPAAYPGERPDFKELILEI